MNLINSMELTSVNGRDASVDQIVEDANAAFSRIEKHRRLFRRDWLPFIDGVNHFSTVAWERTGRHQTRDRKPDWTYDATQTEFRELSKDLSWARYFDTRRTLLSVVRSIGGERDDFLKWYDGLEESIRDRVGHPETLWKMYKNQKKNPARDADHDDDLNNRGAASTDTTNGSAQQHSEQVNARGAAAKAAKQATIRSNEDRNAELVAKNERWHDFGVDLRTSLGSGESTLKTGLRKELGRLLEDAA